MREKIIYRSLLLLLFPVGYAIYQAFFNAEQAYSELGALMMTMSWALMETGILFILGVAILIWSNIKRNPTESDEVLDDNDGPYHRLQRIGDSYLKAALLVFLAGVFLSGMMVLYFGYIIN